MVRIGRVLRDYSDAGGVNTLLAIWGFVDDDGSGTQTAAAGCRGAQRGPCNAVTKRLAIVCRVRRIAIVGG